MPESEVSPITHLSLTSEEEISSKSSILFHFFKLPLRKPGILLTLCKLLVDVFFFKFKSLSIECIPNSWS